MSSNPGKWPQGSASLLRYTDLARAEVLQALPCRVVRDDSEMVALYVPDGTPCKLSRRLDRPGPMTLGPHVIEDALWRRDLLRLMFPGCAYSIWLLWDCAPRRFAYWYVNLEAPFSRTDLGFDTVDYELDVVIEPDLSFRLKDEDHLAESVDAGLLSTSAADAIRSTARGVIDRAVRRLSPFGDGWERWVPSALPAELSVPHGWDRLAKKPNAVPGRAGRGRAGR